MLEDSIANLLLTILTEGRNRIEREGNSFEHPCKPLFIATYNPEEKQLPSRLFDLFAMGLFADSPLAVEQRIEGVNRAIADKDTPQAFQERYAADVENLQLQVTLARQLLPGVAIARHQIAYLVSEAERAQVEGYWGELCAVWVAKARAALSGRTIVNAEDLQVGVELAKDGETLPEEFEIPPQTGGDRSDSAELRPADSPSPRQSWRGKPSFFAGSRSLRQAHVSESNAEQPDIEQELLEIAARIRALGMQLLLIDTDRKFVSAGFARELALQANGNYYCLPRATDETIVAMAQEAVSSLISL